MNFLFSKKIIELYILLSFTLLFLVNIKDSHADNLDSIFRIENAQSSQTGFSVLGKTGIVTALHGVAGGKEIVAVNSIKAYRNLEIVSVNIEHDLALLSSDEIKHEIKKGLKAPSNPPNYTGLHVVGYPFSVNLPMPSSQLTIRNVVKLQDLIPSGYDFRELLNGLIKRKSPSVSLDVLSIEGHLLPGHSGAPILNGKDEVVGVADGGLKGGSVGISWAIPYNKDIKWEPRLSKINELKRVAVLPVLFSYSVFQAPNGDLLEWQKPRAGKMMTWDEANDYVEEKNREGLMGHHDWRLPAIGELQDLAKFIKDALGSYSDTDKLYWSSEYRGSSLWESEVLHAFAVNLGDAGERELKFRKSKRLAVRLVRNI